MNIEKLIDKIIPPSDYQHRNGFSNIHVIDLLNVHEKKLVEDALINMLMTKTDDTLIVETLAYLKSVQSLPILYKFLENCSDSMAKLIVATSIFEINKDDNMIDVAIRSFKHLDNNTDAYYAYKLISAFYYLIKFDNLEANRIIEEYINHKEYLISYNAKQALCKKDSL